MRLVHRRTLGPADLVTLTRLLLAVVVALLVVTSLGRSGPVDVVVGLSAVALALDWVDGQVARRTGTSSAFGARLDMESDAFLIAVLSVHVAAEGRWWVLAIGAARYVLWLAERALPWLRRPVPPRYWRKVVAAVQGIALTVATAEVLPGPATTLLLLTALVLLAESFGRDVWWLWRSRRVEATYPVGGGATLVAAVTVWAALVLPVEPGGPRPDGLVRLPLEGVLLVLLALVLGRRLRRATGVVVGVALAGLVVVKALDLGFRAVLDRPFDPLSDWSYLGPGVGVLGDSIGRPAALATVALVAVAVLAVLLLLPLCVVRLVDTAAARRRTAGRAAAAAAAVWILCAMSGLSPVTRVASTSAVDLAYDEVRQVHADVVDRRTFARQVADDRFAGTSGDRLLRGLRGKDVLLVFVESYGRVAVQDSSFSPGVDAVLADGTRRLRAAGFGARSAFLTSPTFGAASWLAHSTLQSGLWVDSQQRYDQLLDEDRLTLTSAFARAGWRTVLDVPANTEDWPQGQRFYGFDTIYDSRNVGYQGPPFSYAPVPDQYTLQELRRSELAGGHAPVMAEVDLVSSHHPWTPLPHLVGWDDVGDGSVYDDQPAQGRDPAEVFADPDAVRVAYGRSIEYSIGSVLSFLETYPDPDLVVVMLGDHQPHSYVTGPDPGHDVPVSVIARDPDVLGRVAGWRWQPGLRPRPDAPVWPMDAFRDRFLTAFGRP